MFKKIKRYIKYLFNYRKNNGISFKESLELLSLPVIPLKCKDLNGNIYSVNFLLDTGADSCIIDKSFTVDSNLKLNSIGYTSGFITASDKMDESCVADIVQLSIILSDNEITNNFTIRDMSSIFNTIKSESGIQLHGILGSDFFNEHKYILDFECHKIY